MTGVFTRRAVLLGGAGAAAGVPGLAFGQSSTAPLAVDALARRRVLGAVKSWGYQLRRIDFDRVARSAHDLIVIDNGLSQSQRFVRRFTAEEIARARVKPDGSRRIVLAYLSIGEAERYRSYWQPAWDEPGRAPPWLGAMNPQWVGNYPVRFWQPEWQSFIIGGGDSYVAEIQRQGFDGLYLDRADVFQEWQGERPTAEADMAAFLLGIAAVARAGRPDFLIVLQNAEELLKRAPVLAAIDGIAKEDLYFGLDHTEGENAAADVAASLGYLRRARKSGRVVFVVEYVKSAAKIAALEMRARKEGFLPHVTDRTLWRLIEPPLSDFLPADVPPPPP